MKGQHTCKFSSSPLSRGGRINNTDQVVAHHPLLEHNSQMSKMIQPPKTPKKTFNTHSSADAIIAAAYAFPSLCNAAPLENKPALKKYGEVRPDLRTNDPNFRTPSARLNSKNSFWYGATPVGSASASQAEE
mmetsp:Transcript_36137/g.108147  ORF Transcript_36137/g.108147 Transcript_36137/m.108147 type:complete len:132 (-) Transcript_36137:475-870(-)